MLLNALSMDNEKYEKLEENSTTLQIIDSRNIAFPEDKISRGMKIFEGRHEKLNFESAIQYQNDQIAFSRLQQSEELKSWLCKLPQTGFKIAAQSKKLEFNPYSNSDKNQESSQACFNLLDFKKTLFFERGVGLFC